jgi:hypothetical protein
MEGWQARRQDTPLEGMVFPDARPVLVLSLSQCTDDPYVLTPAILLRLPRK